MSDIWTIMWKEAKDLFFQGGWRSLLRPLIVVAIMGIYVPLQIGPQWVRLDPVEMMLLLWVPLFLIISFAGDLVAGERERHTLETLLATRIPDHAILLGKIATTALYGWGMSVSSLLLGLVLVNLSGAQGSWVFYPLDRFAGALALGLLVSVLGTSAGVLISLRAATARQAQQILSVSTLAFVFGSLIALRATLTNVIPMSVISSLSYWQFLLIAIVVLALLDAILLGWSLLRFRRARLILS